ncbi:MAG: alpha/beta hydrolase [Bacteroidota bacterium]
MKTTLTILIGILFFLSSCTEEPNHDSPNEDTPKENGVQEISFYTPDSIKIFGDLYVTDKQANTIILFHQGGSNARGEYNPIIPRLTEKGFNVLATDQRSGGQYFGSYNRTLANIPTNSYGDGYGYCDAYNNLESALDYIINSELSGKKIIWGSSYSASLAIKLANNRPNDVDGVLAFSPASGGPLKDCLPEQYLETITVPLIILKPPNEMESERSKTQFELAEKYNHQTYAAKNGVHGSSMLVKERVKKDVEETWNVVYAFLDDSVK